MTALAGAAVAPQTLVWSSDPAACADAIVEGSFTNAELRALGTIVEEGADDPRYRLPGGGVALAYWNLRGLAHELREFRHERRVFGGRQDFPAVSILARRRYTVGAYARRDLAEFRHAFARFAPREEALRRAAQNFNPTPTFDPVDFLEHWNRCSDDLVYRWRAMATSVVRGELWEALKLLTIAELDQLRASAKELQQTTRAGYRGLIAYYRFMAEEIVRFKTWQAVKAA